MLTSIFDPKNPLVKSYDDSCVINGAINTIEQAVEFINFIRTKKLTEIDFWLRFESTPEIMQLIAEYAIKPCMHLKTIRINSLKNCGEEGLRYILDAVKANPTIVTVRLNNLDISDKITKEFEDVLKDHQDIALQRLKTISIKFNDIPKGCKYIASKSFEPLSIISVVESFEGFDIRFLEVADKAKKLLENCKPAVILEYANGDTSSDVEKDALAVGQGEVGFSTHKMGTENIKQCVVLILHDPISHSASLAHIDRIRSLESIIQLIKSFPKCKKLDAYLVGAQSCYGGEEYAEGNLQKALMAIVASERNIDIKGASVLNTEAPLQIVFNPQDGVLMNARPGVYHDSYQKDLTTDGIIAIRTVFDHLNNDVKTITTHNTDLDDCLVTPAYPDKSYGDDYKTVESLGDYQPESE